MQRDPDPSEGRNRGLLRAMLWTSLVALATGLPLIFLYKPDAQRAHASVRAIQDDFGILRGLHHWSSALLILLGAIYVLSGLFKRAYRPPIRRLWFGALALTALALLLQLSGHLLPWDAHAVRTTVIEVGIAESVPVVGPMQANLLRGGEAVSPSTLRLWYWAHVTALPLLAALATLLLWRGLRRLDRPRGALVWPLAAMAALLVVSLAWPAPLGREATVADMASYEARPEWYVLPLHSLLTFAQSIRPQLAFVGTVVVPAVGAAVLIALPFLDRRGRWGRPLAIVGAISLAGLFVLSAGKVAPLTGDPLPEPVKVVITGPKRGPDPALAAVGRTVYRREGCDGCHQIDGQGEDVGPDLTHVGSRRPDFEWHAQHLRDPDSLVPGSTMPDYAELPEGEIDALSMYMLSLRVQAQDPGPRPSP